jgi:hypothetical protein
MAIFSEHLVSRGRQSSQVMRKPQRGGTPAR